MSDSEPTTIIFCHGAWEGPWFWEPALALIPDRPDRRLVVADFPSSGDPDQLLGTFADDVAELTRHIDDAPGSVILVGHSMAGATITQAAADQPAVTHLYLAAAFLPDIGQSCLDLLPAGPLPRSIVLDATGEDRRRDYATYDPQSEDLLNGCTPATVAWATPRWRTQRISTAATPVTAAAWRHVPCTYLRATEDHSIPPELQTAMAARAHATIIDVPTGHMIPLTHPRLIAELLCCARD